MAQQSDPINDLLPYVSSELNSGQTPEALRADLRLRNIPADVAERAITRARQLNRRRVLAGGAKFLLIGVSFLAVGLAITLGSYHAARRDGGVFVVTIGMLGFGVGYTIAGSVRLLSALASDR